MKNTSIIQANISIGLVNKGVSVKAFLSMTPCFFLLYINGVMLFTLRSKTTFRETSRYVLFGHMLYADTLHLLVCMVMYMFAVTRVHFTVFSCLSILIVGTIIARIAPLNLAVMSLERYVAICFPLRHAEIATHSRTSVAIGVVWILGSLNSLTELFVFMVYESLSAPMHVFCSRNTLFKLKIYVNINKAFTVIYFVSVGIVIAYTYIAIIEAARSAATEKCSNHKAHKTVLLHLVQLGLCLASILFDTINALLKPHLDELAILNVQYVLFLGLIIFPRCLSPLIYGLRDQTFSRSFRFYFSLGLRVIIKPVVIDGYN